MKSLTTKIMETISPAQVSAMLTDGRDIARLGRKHPIHGYLIEARMRCAHHRSQYGFAAVSAPLLTAPDENMKLAKGSVPSYGLTLQHYVTKLQTGLTVNACPWAGDCTKVCVLDNGSGAYTTVQAARRWKTEMLAHSPHAFFLLLGWEIQRAVMKHGTILLRPNVNSDISWHLVAPALVDGSVFGNAVKLYGYTKDLSILSTDGWLTPHYRVAYSWNERSPIHAQSVAEFLRNGGSVAMVTNRKVALGRRRAQPFDATNLNVAWQVAYGVRVAVVDADLTDEWIFQPSTVGDLAAKGKAEKLVGKSNFIVNCY